MMSAEPFTALFVSVCVIKLKKEKTKLVFWFFFDFFFYFVIILSLRFCCFSFIWGFLSLSWLVFLMDSFQSVWRWCWTAAAATCDQSTTTLVKERKKEKSWDWTRGVCGRDEGIGSTTQQNTERQDFWLTVSIKGEPIQSCVPTTVTVPL